MLKLARDVYELIRHVLQEDGREFKSKCGGYWCQFKFTLPLHDSCTDCLHYEIRFIDDFYLVYTHSEFQADLHDKQKMWNLATFLLQANQKLYDGDFQMDFQSGEICLEILHKCDGHVPSEIIIREDIENSAHAFEIYGWGIAGILADEFTTADQAFEFCRGVRLEHLNEFINNL